MNSPSLEAGAPGIPLGVWVFLGGLILWDIGAFVFTRFSNRTDFREPLGDVGCGAPRASLPFELPSFDAPTATGNPLWKTVLYFVLASVVTLVVGFSLLVLFGVSSSLAGAP